MAKTPAVSIILVVKCCKPSFGMLTPQLGLITLGPFMVFGTQMIKVSNILSMTDIDELALGLIIAMVGSTSFVITSGSTAIFP